MKAILTQEFYPLIPDVTKKLRKAKLTAAEWRIWSYLVEVDPWGDRYQDLNTLSVMSECDVSKATLYRAIAKFQELELFDFQDKGFSIRNREGISKLRQPDKKLREDYRKNETENSEMRQDSQNCENGLKNETENSEMRQDSQNCENQEPESLPDKDSEPSQTIQINKNIQTPQTKEEVDFNFEEEEKETELQSLSDISLHSVLKPPKKAKKIINKVTQIPEELISKLEELEIPLDATVKKTILEHDISQAYGAASHIEQTWETINNPRSVFLYQISRQKAEKLRPVGKVYTAKDFGFTLADLKFTYPNNWREAAEHFGVEIPESEKLESPVKEEVQSQPLPMISASSLEEDESSTKGFELIANIKAKIAEKFNMPMAEPTSLEQDKEMTELERLNEWISDPILRREVEHKLRTSDRYHVEYDEEGIPYKVTSLRF